MTLFRILSVAAFAALVTASAAQEFGIAGWVHDPVSLATFLNAGDNSCTREVKLNHVDAAMHSMLTWCDELGYQIMTVDFDNPSYYDYFRGHRVRAINTMRPAFVDSLFWSRDKTAYAYWPTWIDRQRRGGFPNWTEARQGPVLRTVLGGDTVHLIQQMAPDTMWFPSPLENLRGWGPGNYMPIHFKITCAADLDSEHIEDYPVLATVSLLVRDQPTGLGDEEDESSSWYSDSIYTWTRYPTISIAVSQFLGHEHTLMEIDTIIDPSAGDFRAVNGSNWQEVGDPLSSYSFAGWRPVRVGVNYLGGNHTFYLDKIEIWDDDFDQFCVSRDPDLAEAVADAYYAEYQGHENELAGWMLDDFLSDVERPMARIMEIVRGDSRHMPPFYSSSFNDWLNRSFFDTLDAYGVPRPIQCNEQYWLGGDSTRRGLTISEGPLSFLYTDSSSDVRYVDLRYDEAECQIDGNPPRAWHQINGYESLQFSIDQGIWGVRGAADLLDGEAAGFSATWIPPKWNISWPQTGGMRAEIDMVHSYGEKYYALLQSGRFGNFWYDGCPAPDEDVYWAQFPTREPSQNELKLLAWLAVANDADGIMWYGTLSDSRLSPSPSRWPYTGFFEWGQIGANGEVIPDVYNRNNFCLGARQVCRTPRYYAAKEVHEDIQRIAPVLSHLDFVSTYGSSVFEATYASFDCTWVKRDDLLTYNVGGQSVVSSVSEIMTYKPWGDPPLWEEELPYKRFVQVSRFMTPGAQGTEDYWFLIVNRRVLTSDTAWGYPEERLVEMKIDNVVHQGLNEPYFVQRYLKGDVIPTEVDDYGRTFQVQLDPGDAEFVHFFYADTTDTVVTSIYTVLAPFYSPRNIIIRGAGKLTILPDTAALGRIINVAGHDSTVYDSVATVTFWKGKGIRVESNSTSDSSRLVIRGSVVNGDTIRVRLQPALTDSSWTGIKVTSGQGQGQVTMHLADVTGAKRGFWRYGKSIQADSLVDCRFYGNETGVLCQSSPANSAIFVGQCKLEDNRDFGLRIGGKVKATLHGSSISDNRTGIAAVSSSIVTLINCDVLRNADEGISLASGVILTDSVGGLIANNGGHAISATKSCTVNLDHSAVTQNGAPQSEGGVKAVDSQLRLRCSEIRDNTGTGLFVYRGSVLMSDTATSGNFRWGGNRLSNNTMEQLQLDSVSVLGFANGENVVIGNPTTDIPWVDWNNLWTPLSYRRNHWGFASDADSAKVVGNQLSPDQPPHLSPVVWVKPVKPDSTRCLWEPDGGPSDVPPCFVDANTKEVDGDLSNAQSDYKSIIQSTLADCGKYASIARLLAIDALGGFNNAETREFLTAVLDTTNDDELRHVTRLAVAQTWSKDQEWDSATTIYSMIHDEAGTNLYRRIDAELGLVTTAILETEFDDTTGGPSYEAFQSYRDTVEQILDQRFSWHQWQITDSVVMYAPMRVDSAIEIHAGGVLTILPRPGSARPVVHFGPDAGIYSYGYQGRAKLYVLGEADNPVVLSWDSSSAWANVQTLGGDVYMKHATLQGRGFLSYSDATYGYFDFEVDSCQFEGFDEGIWVWAADSGSYIKNSVLTGLGGSAGYETGMGFGTGLTVLEGEQFTVENCSFVNNQGVGLFGYFCSALDVRNTIITGSSEYGILVWDGGELNLECTEVTQNGDTLPELWVENGVVDLVEGHNLFADSGGTLIYSASPSYIDVEDGQNRFELYSDSGKYFESGLPNSTWDVTYNNWSPLTPADQGFYDHLTPTNPAKWTVDSSLASFVACGDGGAMSMGGNLLVVGQAEETPGVDSRQGDAERGPARISTDHHASKLAKSAGSGLQRLDRSALYSDSPEPSSPSRDAVRLHHTELAQWREFNALAKSNQTAAAIDAGKQFLTTAPGSPLVASALVRLVSLADHSNPAAGLSSALVPDQQRLTRISRCRAVGLTDC